MWMHFRFVMDRLSACRHSTIAANRSSAAMAMEASEKSLLDAWLLCMAPNVLRE
jgi:hypothetical protein